MHLCWTAIDHHPPLIPVLTAPLLRQFSYPVHYLLWLSISSLLLSSSLSLSAFGLDRTSYYYYALYGYDYHDQLLISICIVAILIYSPNPNFGTTQSIFSFHASCLPFIILPYYAPPCNISLMVLSLFILVSKCLGTQCTPLILRKLHIFRLFLLLQN